MVEKTLADLEKLKLTLESLDREFVTTQIVDMEAIKKKLVEEAKRELQGRSSYGTGVR